LGENRQTYANLSWKLRMRPALSCGASSRNEQSLAKIEAGRDA